MSAAYLDLAPIGSVRGTVRLPGSKSISNRTLLLAALAEGVTEVRGLLESDDTARMLDALAALGIKVERRDDATIVTGAGGAIPVRDAELFLGNAGTAFRPLTAVLALAGGRYRLTGVARMHERPIGDLVDALRALGARITYLGNDGFPPLAIEPPDPSAASRVSVRGNVSSQFLTALLLAAPMLQRPIAIDVEGELISKPYVAMTVNLMARFGVPVVMRDWSRFEVGGAYRSPGTIHVEGDASAASYFLAAGAIGGGPVRVEGVGRDSIQGDAAFAAVLESMGAVVAMGSDWIEVRRGARPLRAIDADLNRIPDAAMTIAVAALFADGPSVIRNIGSWRVKETDRIAAMAAELAKVGATVEAGSDYLRVEPPAKLRNATIETYDDHRMAMCFSLVALGGVPVRILDPGCVAKTFPEYFDVLAGLVAAPVIAIDGPSASGKGTVAALVAEQLGFHYLDSGALYRLVALAADRRGVAWNDAAGLVAIAAGLDVRFGRGRILLEGDDVTEAIRSEHISAGASKVAPHEVVRAALLARQRAFHRPPGLVAEGRDMGSVVFPAADLKVFLTASVEARAARRHKQLIGKGIPASIDDLLLDLAERDRRDTSRAVAPLVQTPDAYRLDTTTLTVDEAVDAVLAWFAKRQMGD